MDFKKLVEESKIYHEIAGVSFDEAYAIYSDGKRQDTKAKRVVYFRIRDLVLSFLAPAIAMFTFPLHNSVVVVYCSFAVLSVPFFLACRSTLAFSKSSSRAELLNSALIDKRIELTREAIAKARDDPMMPVDDDVLDAADRAMTTRV
jgi:hypothetical protein